MIIVHGNKITPDQFARYVVHSDGVGADFWHGRYESTYERMTQREVDMVDAAIEKHQQRVAKLLNVAPIHSKVYGE